MKPTIKTSVAQNAATYVESLLRKAQEKKAFKDTENRIGGSKKEKAAYRKVDSSSLVELEKNEVNAIELVRKEKVYPKVDVDAERKNGVSAGVVFLKMKMRQSFAPTPLNNSESRKAYVSYVESIVSLFRNIKTLKEFKQVQAILLKDFTEIEYQTRRRIISIVGTRFINFIYSYKYPYLAANYDATNNWDWAKKKVVSKTKKKELEINTYPSLSFIKRVGGIKITDADITVESIQQKFGFKEIEFGNALRDAESRERIQHFLGAMADLGSVLNMDIIKMNSIGNLSLAFATRGSGKAGAHYEQLAKIINLTKNRGGGAVAHEYGHYIDNILPVINNSEYQYKLFASEASENVKNEKIRNAVKNIFDYIYGRKNSEQKLYIKKTIEASEKSYLIPDAAIGDDIETYFDNLKKKYPGFFSADKLRKKQIAVLGCVVKKFGYKSYEFSFESKKSAYYTHSLNMSSDYWARPCELFARAFETYISDKLAKAGRENNYLVSGVYFERAEKVYPMGEERNDLFILYDKLMEVIKKECGIGDFKEWTNEKVTEYVVMTSKSS
jgi:hypothetical protein